MNKPVREMNKKIPRISQMKLMNKKKQKNKLMNKMNQENKQKE